MWYLDSGKAFVPYATVNEPLPDTWCAELIERAQSVEVKDGTTTGGAPGKRQSQVRWLKKDKFADIYRPLVDIALSMNRQFWNMDLDFFETLQYTEYSGEDEGHYGRHVDMSYRQHPVCRKLSMVILLQEPLLGGEFYIQPEGENHRVPMGVGQITFFPSYISHHVVPVSKGKRISLVGWMNGPQWR